MLPRLLEQLLPGRPPPSRPLSPVDGATPLNGEGDVTASPAHAITYLHRDGYFGRDHGVY